MITGAVFDVDGTLLDSMGIWERAGEMYLSRLGIESGPGLGRILYPMSMDEGAAYLRERYCLDQTVKEITAGVSETVRDFYFFQVNPKPGVIHFLKMLQARGIPMAIATSSDRQVVEGALDRLGMNRFFKGIFTCSQAGAGKSRPDVYELALKSLDGAKRESTWVFEDAFFAARTAGEAGFPVVGVYDPFSDSSQQRLMEASDYYMKDFHDFEGFIRQADRG